MSIKHKGWNGYAPECEAKALPFLWRGGKFFTDARRGFFHHLFPMRRRCNSQEQPGQRHAGHGMEPAAGPPQLLGEESGRALSLLRVPPEPWKNTHQQLYPCLFPLRHDGFFCGQHESAYDNRPMEQTQRRIHPVKKNCITFLPLRCFCLSSRTVSKQHE